MGVLCVILGILMFIFGFSIIVTPLMNFLSLGVLFSIVLLLWGIITLVRSVSQKKYNANFVLSIIAIVLGFLLVVSPAASFVTDVIILYVAAAFMIIRSLVSIIVSIRYAKESPSKGAVVAGIILGIIGLILGIILFAYPLLQAAVLGILVAFFFIFTGIDLIMLGVAGGRGTDGMDGSAVA